MNLKVARFPNVWSILQMTSELTKTDLEMLLSMEIKLRLLDTEGITIPEQPPQIPKDPPNFDFAYQV